MTESSLSLKIKNTGFLIAAAEQSLTKNQALKLLTVEFTQA